jgi:hypothetical protein
MNISEKFFNAYLALLGRMQRPEKGASMTEYAILDVRQQHQHPHLIDALPRLRVTKEVERRCSKTKSVVWLWSSSPSS